MTTTQKEESPVMRFKTQTLSGVVPGAGVALQSVPHMPSETRLILGWLAFNVCALYVKPLFRLTGVAFEKKLQGKLRVTAADLQRYGQRADP